MATVQQPRLLWELESLMRRQSGATRGHRYAGSSPSQRNIASALQKLGFAVSQRLVGKLLRRDLGYRCQANRKKPKRPATLTPTPIRAHQCHGQGGALRRLRHCRKPSLTLGVKQPPPVRAAGFR